MAYSTFFTVLFSLSFTFLHPHFPSLTFIFLHTPSFAFINLHSPSFILIHLHYMIFGLFGQFSSIWDAAIKHNMLNYHKSEKKSNYFLASLCKDFNNVYTRSPPLFFRYNTFIEGGSWGYPYIRRVSLQITHPAQERLATPPGFTFPTLFEQWCGFFYVQQEPDKWKCRERDLRFFVVTWED